MGESDTVQRRKPPEGTGLPPRFKEVKALVSLAACQGQASSWGGSSPSFTTRAALV